MQNSLSREAMDHKGKLKNNKPHSTGELLGASGAKLLELKVGEAPN